MGVFSIFIGWQLDDKNHGFGSVAYTANEYNKEGLFENDDFRVRKEVTTYDAVNSKIAQFIDVEKYFILQDHRTDVEEQVEESIEEEDDVKIER
jgi:hypothetical protein